MGKGNYDKKNKEGISYTTRRKRNEDGELSFQDTIFLNLKMFWFVKDIGVA